MQVMWRRTTTRSEPILWKECGGRPQCGGKPPTWSGTIYSEDVEEDHCVEENHRVTEKWRKTTRGGGGPP